MNSNNIYNKSEDFYFGKLPHELLSSDLKFKFIYRNMSQYVNFDKYLNNDYSIVLPNSSGFKKELIYLIKCFFFYLSFKKKITKLYHNSYFEEKKFFLKFQIFFSIVNNLRFEDLTKHIIKKFKPKYIISTFEGHAWERILFKVAN